MLCEHILGNRKDQELGQQQIEYVEIEWDEAFKKIHRKETDQGREVGIRLDDSVLIKGISEGDILYLDELLAIVVKMKACRVLIVEIDGHHRQMTAKVCYEIGNRHAPLFFGENELQFVTPFNMPLFRMFSDFHGVTVRDAIAKLDLDRRVSNTINIHQHGNESQHHDGHESGGRHDHR